MRTGAAESAGVGRVCGGSASVSAAEIGNRGTGFLAKAARRIRESRPLEWPTLLRASRF